MNKELLKTLVRDFRIPIGILEEPYFSHFKNLLDPYYKINDKIKLIEGIEGAAAHNFMQQKHELRGKITNHIKSNPVYETYNNFKVPDCDSSSKNFIYNENETKDIVCKVDLVKANFSMVKLYFPDLIPETSYEELVSLFTNQEYFKKSKILRQIIFSDLNPRKQVLLQKYHMSKFISAFDPENFNRITFASADEYSFLLEPDQSPDEIRLRVQEIFKEIGGEVKVEFYVIDRIHSSHPFYVKKYLDNKVEFSQVPKFFLPQVVRHYENQDKNPMDLFFEFEGKICQFKDFLFED